MDPNFNSESNNTGGSGSGSSSNSNPPPLPAEASTSTAGGGVGSTSSSSSSSSSTNEPNTISIITSNPIPESHPVSHPDSHASSLLFNIEGDNRDEYQSHTPHDHEHSPTPTFHQTAPPPTTPAQQQGGPDQPQHPEVSQQQQQQPQPPQEEEVEEAAEVVVAAHPEPIIDANAIADTIDAGAIDNDAVERIDDYDEDEEDDLTDGDIVQHPYHHHHQHEVDNDDEDQRAQEELLEEEEQQQQQPDQQQQRLHSVAVLPSYSTARVSLPQLLRAGRHTSSNNTNNNNNASSSSIGNNNNNNNNNNISTSPAASRRTRHFYSNNGSHFSNDMFPGSSHHHHHNKSSNQSSPRTTNSSSSSGGSGTTRHHHPHHSHQQHQHHHSSSSHQGSSSAVDPLRLLYPNVNENETPLPRCWSPHDKCLSIGLSQNNLRVTYKGVGKQHSEAASVRTAYPIPPSCGLYYFEVRIISKGRNGYMGIGLTAQQFRMNRLPGWDKQSYGYHGDDGNSFSSSGNGQTYGPTFTTGDVIGCCVNFVNNTCFYTKNGVDLGIAFRDLPTKLYPTVGLQTPGEEVDANFGQEPFKFDKIVDMMKEMRATVLRKIDKYPHLLETPENVMNRLVSTYLVHNGYSKTAEAFTGYTDQQLDEEMSSIKTRQKIIKLIQTGKMGQAIDHTLRSYPGLLENNKNLWFSLKCRQFIEMINGADLENASNKVTATTQTMPTNQTSVIQSTKTFKHSGSNKGGGGGAAAAGQGQSQNNTANPAVIKQSGDKQDLKGIIIDDNSNKCVDEDEDQQHQNDSSNSMDVEMEPINSHSNGDNGEGGNGSGDPASTGGGGDSCSNGNANSSAVRNSLDAIDEEEMDVDISPSSRTYGRIIEKILEFGKELSCMGQQLEKENLMTEEERQMLEDAFSLIAYSNPWSSPLGWLLCPSRRENVSTTLNSAILESLNFERRPPLEYLVAHAAELIKIIGQHSLGEDAFVTVDDIFPQN
ncbi:ran-binding proteins 9/10 homolog isoform X2 [Drosophila willistoni]|uniref:ran-binding proteins 9/10 homolog isoform X2 n=1 Tax=Drosophila willistoni TaxID=7260 RepID=UPI000C26C685|nr:ran-binding proteins 9/10 homolog isoform X2 [Drosophila willistoni]